MPGSSAVLDMKLEPSDVAGEVVVAAMVGEAITWKRLKTESSADQTTRDFFQLMTEGAPEERSQWPVHLWEFHVVREALTVEGSMVSLKERLLVPRKLRTEVLDILHAAHNGTSGMEARARELVWWPGIKEDITQRQTACRKCIEAAPSQPAPPPVKPPQPD